MSKTIKITKSQINNLINEEVARFKKIKSLENRKNEILSQLNEMYETEELTELGIDEANIFQKAGQALGINKAPAVDPSIALNAAYDAKSQEFLANIQKNPQWASVARQNPQALANMQKSIATAKANVVKAAADRVTQNKIAPESIIFTFTPAQGGNVKADFTVSKNVKSTSLFGGSGMSMGTNMGENHDNL